MLVEAIARTDLLEGIPTLALHGDLTVRGIQPLLDVGRRFEVLDVRHTQIATVDAKRIAKLAPTIIIEDAAPLSAAAPPKQVGEWLVRHTRKPEWGIGRVIEELDDGLQVQFENGGTKHVRNVELLEEIEN